MMQMLVRGGLAALVDEKRPADENNPLGYFEYAPVKRLDQPMADQGWLREACGRALKVVSPLLGYLPPSYRYRVLFMQRDLDEVLRSQAKMIAQREQSPPTNDDTLRRMYSEHLESIQGWLQAQAHIEALFVDYNALMRDPVAIVARIAGFLPLPVDQNAMIRAVNPRLYRNRSAG